MSGLQTLVDIIITYKWFAIILLIGIAAFLLLRAYGKGILKFFESSFITDMARRFERSRFFASSQIFR